MTENLDWFIVHTKSKQDRICADSLERKKFGVYLPMRQTIISHARKKQIVMRPAMGRYLFVGVSTAEALGRQLAEIKRSIGVEWLIQPAGSRAPMSIPEKIIDDLRKAEDAGAFDDVDCNRLNLPAPLPRRGDIVKLREGPFAEMIAEVSRAQSEHRIEIVIKHARIASRITTTLAKLEKVA